MEAAQTQNWKNWTLKGGEILIFLFLSNLAWSTDEEQSSSSSSKQIRQLHTAALGLLPVNETRLLPMGVRHLNEEIMILHKENQELKQRCDAELTILRMENKEIDQFYAEELVRLHKENQDLRQSYNEKIMRLYKENQTIRHSCAERITRLHNENQMIKQACLTCTAHGDHILLEDLLKEAKYQKALLAKKIENLISMKADQDGASISIEYSED